MHTIAEIRVDPLSEGPSVAGIIKQACDILGEEQLRVQVHDMGTNVEGDLQNVLHALQRIHDLIHAQGLTRMVTHLSVETRTDKQPALTSPEEGPPLPPDIEPPPRLA